MNLRYSIQKADGFGGTDVYHVADAQDASNNPYGPAKPIEVWVHGERAQCTCCSGPLEAMLSSCPHARAVMRYIKKHTRGEGQTCEQVGRTFGVSRQTVSERLRRRRRP